MNRAQPFVSTFKIEQTSNGARMQRRQRSASKVQQSVFQLVVRSLYELIYSSEVERVTFTSNLLRDYKYCTGKKAVTAVNKYPAFSGERK